MSLVKIADSFIRSSDGAVVPPGTPCYVYNRGTKTLAALENQAGEPIANPTPIIGGLLEAYVATGSYDLNVTVDGVTKTQPYEAFLATEVAAGSNPFTHVQSEASATWAFTHPLGHLPASVALYDEAGNKFEANVACTTTTVTIAMDGGITASGKAVVI